MNSVFKKILRNFLYLVLLVSSIVLIAYLVGGIITGMRLFLIMLEGILILWVMSFFPIIGKYDLNKSLERGVRPFLTLTVVFPIVMGLSYAINRHYSLHMILLVAGLFFFIFLLLDMYRHNHD